MSLFKSAEEFLACRKSKEAARECPGPGGTLVARPRKSWELLLQLPEIPILSSRDEFRECPKLQNKLTLTICCYLFSSSCYCLILSAYWIT